MLENILDLFGYKITKKKKCEHNYVFLKQKGWTYQQFKCTKCGKLKLKDQ